MRTPQRWSVAVRRHDGSVHTESHSVQPSALTRLPFLRGPVALVDATRVALDAIGVALKVTTGQLAERRQLAVTFVPVGVGFLVLFVAGPGMAVGGAGIRGTAAAAAEAAVRLGMFFVYLALISRSRGAVQLFRYHGAEHKVIAAFERSQTLPALDEARRFSPVHNRCGTNFASLFVVVAGFVYAPVTRSPLFAGALLRVVLVPVVGALAYEVMRLAAREHDRLWSRVVVWPGRAAQRITTREPDDAELEVARAALGELLPRP